MEPPSPYLELRARGGVAWALPGHAPVVAWWLESAATLHAVAAAAPDAERLRGRGTVWALPAPGGKGAWVVRHYARGGALAPLLGDRYPALGTPRPFGELLASERARERGVATPRVLAAAVYVAGPLAYRGDIVTERVAGRDLARVLFGRADYDSPAEDVGSGPTASAALRAAGRAGGALERAGVHHRDLNIKNLLLDGDAAAPRAWVLDLDRARVLERPSPAAGAAMRRRLLRSLGKWERRTGTPLGADARRAVEEGWRETSSGAGGGDAGKGAAQ